MDTSVGLLSGIRDKNLLILNFEMKLNLGHIILALIYKKRS
jgi:hypothetical protein